MLRDRAADMQLRGRLLTAFLVPSTSVFRVGTMVVKCDLPVMIELSPFGRNLSWRKPSIFCWSLSSIPLEGLHLMIGEFIKRSVRLYGLVRHRLEKRGQGLR